LESIAQVGGVLDFSEFRTLAAEIAGLKTIDRLFGQTMAPGLARVRVMSPSSLAYRDYRWVFVPGLADGEFPSRYPANPLLSDETVEAINNVVRPRRLHTTRDRNRREPLYLFMLLDSARERATLTFPASTLEGEPVVASIYVGEIARHFESSPVGSLRAVQSLRDRGECLRRIAQEWRSGSIDDHGAEELLGSGLVQRVRLEQRGAARGDVGPNVVRLGPAWYPSELNALAACPFVFLARHRLGIRTEELPDFEIPATEIGRLAHEALREFYATPVPSSEVAAMTRMEDIIRRRLADADISGQGSVSVFDPSLWKIRRAQLVASLHQYVKFAVTDSFDGYETVARYLGEPLPQAELGNVVLGGRPDHIGIRRIGGRLEGIRVDDFKYSAASAATSRLLRDSFQIPVYAYLASRALQADESTQMDGRYVLLRSPSTPVVSHPIDATVFRDLQSRVEALAEKARAGRLHPEPADRQDCATCDYRRLCRLHGG
jgi:ATP-dependent helicase/DNAse subunit B